MWLWDTYFCSLLASEGSKELGYSNLIEVTRPTVMGNVPGFRTASHTVSDRSKSYVGGLVLAEHYRRFGDQWIVQLLWPEIRIWADWIRRRRVGPLNLVFLGSDNIPPDFSDGAQCSTTAAKWESGLDNSPMYDGLEVTKAQLWGVCQFEQYDVGMTGLYHATLAALAELAPVAGYPDEAGPLAAAADAVAAAMRAHMWNQEAGIFQNLGYNGTLSPRVSPFNLHPLLAGAATADQARRMAGDWLSSPKGFCLGDAPGSCTFGLPSIAAG